jgi:ArsR family transcriptional regulator
MEVKLYKIFKVLGDANRLRILSALREGDLKCTSEECREGVCMQDLAKSLHMTPPTLSHHIKELVNVGLVIPSKQGRWVYCRLNHALLAEVSNALARFGAKDGSQVELTLMKGEL